MKELIRYLRRHLAVAESPDRVIAFGGDYSSWNEARRHSTGYDAPVILERTRNAIRQVARGDAVFERDSVLIDRPEYPFPVIVGLLRAALLDGPRLSVVDFGGSLGSSYFQCRPLLRGAATLEWSVVEQPTYVAAGRVEFQTDELRFFESVEECRVHRSPNALLLSSVLQYLPEPYAALERLSRHGIPHILIDRTAFLEADRDRLTVQSVPSWIYPASYPAWFLRESKLTATLSAAGYVLVRDFAGSDDISPAGERGYFKGFIFQKRV